MVNCTSELEQALHDLIAERKRTLQDAISEYDKVWESLEETINCIKLEQGSKEFPPSCATRLRNELFSTEAHAYEGVPAAHERVNQKLLGEMIKVHDQLQWEAFKKKYNEQNAKKAAEGYGPGAIVLKSG